MEQETEEHWISISDMMAGLMVIFLFIAISYMLHVRAEKEKIEKIAITYEKLQSDLYADLEKEFEKDLNKWNAVLDRQTLSVRFKEPEVLFAQGEAEVRPAFKNILNDFFPRYIQILRRPKYINDIAEIRIEGHTSSEWQAGESPEDAYIHNMELSQGRTRSVLEYVLQLLSPQIQQNRKWIRNYLTANGLSSSKLILNSDGTENKEESRRVEFRVRTNAEKRIVEIIRRDEQE
ncbi:MAG: OmpA family protein [Candidatus Poribacteria bacterium]|nr:OmpA family protein [Candidatus Poribacteria bacterium]